MIINTYKNKTYVNYGLIKYINSKGIKMITYRCLSAEVAFKSILK